MQTAVPVHRLSRRGLRRRQMRRNLVWAVCLLFLAGGFAGGFFWRQAKSKPAAPEESRSAAVGEAQQAEAYRLFDEAVRARYEERWQGAMNALAEARRVFPEVKGIDILVAEIALEQKDAKTLRAAAGRALQRGDNVASANLLLALESWMKRGEEGESAKQFLGEALQDSPSNAVAHFVRGELSRLLGDGGEAHRNMLAALHRQVPWVSSSLLLLKMHLAAREASEAARTVVLPPPDGRAEKVLALREAVGSGADLGPAVGDMVAVMPALQAMELLDDAAFQAGRVSPEFLALQSRLHIAVPHGVVESPEAR